MNQYQRKIIATAITLLRVCNRVYSNEAINRSPHDIGLNGKNKEPFLVDSNIEEEDVYTGVADEVKDTVKIFMTTDDDYYSSESGSFRKKGNKAKKDKKGKSKKKNKKKDKKSRKRPVNDHAHPDCDTSVYWHSHDDYYDDYYYDDWYYDDWYYDDYYYDDWYHDDYYKHRDLGGSHDHDEDHSHDHDHNIHHHHYPEMQLPEGCKEQQETPPQTDNNSQTPSASPVTELNDSPTFAPARQNPNINPSPTIVPAPTTPQSPSPQATLTPNQPNPTIPPPSPAPNSQPVSNPTTTPNTVPNPTLVTLPTPPPSARPSKGTAETRIPTPEPTGEPTRTLSSAPSPIPSVTPSNLPSISFPPSTNPSSSFPPTLTPTISQQPTISNSPSFSLSPSALPSLSVVPSVIPTSLSSLNPSNLPSVIASANPTSGPTLQPAATPGCPEIAFINEFHYQNLGPDLSEFVEVAHKSTYSLVGHIIYFYDGPTGLLYKQSNDLSTILVSISNEAEGTGFTFSSWQFYAPNDSLVDTVGGIALVGLGNQVLDFISYGGSFTANDGPAAGLTSRFVPVTEPARNGPQNSIQLIGVGARATDFIWAGPQFATPGNINVGQTIDCASTKTSLVSNSVADNIEDFVGKIFVTDLLPNEVESGGGKRKL